MYINSNLNELLEISYFHTGCNSGSSNRKFLFKQLASICTRKVANISLLITPRYRVRNQPFLKWADYYIPSCTSTGLSLVNGYNTIFPRLQGSPEGGGEG
ncbi:hypothetical protein BOH78_4087 [Pichia kudriavzevii]|uniref:Uncharacterized protein n=1 Tax=Pichia kudriavzevii TaxID=4909 RepID=A0A1V2LIR2_PICKU|nr:hypothetical protein BOH78_4087 [Pichia kudriavzevii]